MAIVKRIKGVTHDVKVATDKTVYPVELPAETFPTIRENLCGKEAAGWTNKYVGQNILDAAFYFSAMPEKEQIAAMSRVAIEDIPSICKERDTELKVLAAQKAAEKKPETK